MFRNGAWERDWDVLPAGVLAPEEFHKWFGKLPRSPLARANLIEGCWVVHSVRMTGNVS